MTTIRGKNYSLEILCMCLDFYNKTSLSNSHSHACFPNLSDHATRTRQILGKHHSLLPATPTAQPHVKNLKLNKRKER